MKKGSMFGIRKQTKEEIEETRRQQELFDFYCIPYLEFNSREDSIVVRTERDIDRDLAYDYITEGKELPDYLKVRLLKHKEDEERGIPSRVVKTQPNLDFIDEEDLEELGKMFGQS